MKDKKIDEITLHTVSESLKLASRLMDLKIGLMMDRISSLDFHKKSLEELNRFEDAVLKDNNINHLIKL